MHEQSLIANAWASPTNKSSYVRVLQIPKLFKEGVLGCYDATIYSDASCSLNIGCYIVKEHAILWIKIILGVLTGRTPSIVMVVLAIICSAIAVSLGAFFW